MAAKPGHSVLSRLGNSLYARLGPWALPLVLLIVWQAMAQFGLLSTRVAPSPVSVVVAAWTLTLSGELFVNLGASFQRAIIGTVIGGGLGFALGILNGSSRRLEHFLDTTLQMARNVPHLALIPLVILWFGIDEAGKLFLVALGVFFPIYINTFHGIRSVDAGLIEMGGSYGLGRWGLFRQVVLPSALPSILVGLRFALGFMWLTLIVAETISATTGIGYMAMNAREFMQTDVVVMSILLYALLGKAADLAARALEARLLRWNSAYRAA